MAFLRRLPQWANSLILFVASGLLAVLGTALVIEIQGVSDTRQPLFDGFAAICGPHTMGQDFVATAPGLNRVDLWLVWSPHGRPAEFTPAPTPVPRAAPGLGVHPERLRQYRMFLPIVMRPPDELRFSTSDYWLNSEGCDLTPNNSEGEIVISLKPDPTSPEVIATARVRLDSVEDPATSLRRPYVYRSFIFPPIPDSAGRSFYLVIEAPASAATAPLLARYHQLDLYGGGTRYLDSTQASGDLAFSVHYDNAPLSDLGLILHRLARGQPAPFNWPWLYPLLLAAYVGCVALVIRAAARHLAHTAD